MHSHVAGCRENSDLPASQVPTVTLLPTRTPSLLPKRNCKTNATFGREREVGGPQGPRTQAGGVRHRNTHLQSEEAVDSSWRSVGRAGWLAELRCAVCTEGAHAWPAKLAWVLSTRPPPRVCLTSFHLSWRMLILRASRDVLALELSTVTGR